MVFLPSSPPLLHGTRTSDIHVLASSQRNSPKMPSFEYSLAPSQKNTRELRWIYQATTAITLPIFNACASLVDRYAGSPFSITPKDEPGVQHCLRLLTTHTSWTCTNKGPRKCAQQGFSLHRLTRFELNSYIAIVSGGQVCASAYTHAIPTPICG